MRDPEKRIQTKYRDGFLRPKRSRARPNCRSPRTRTCLDWRLGSTRFESVAGCLVWLRREAVGIDLGFTSAPSAPTCSAVPAAAGAPSGASTPPASRPRPASSSSESRSPHACFLPPPHHRSCPSRCEAPRPRFNHRRATGVRAVRPSPAPVTRNGYAALRGARLRAPTLSLLHRARLSVCRFEPLVLQVEAPSAVVGPGDRRLDAGTRVAFTRGAPRARGLVAAGGHLFRNDVREGRRREQCLQKQSSHSRDCTRGRAARVSGRRMTGTSVRV